jgi:hypothetical protein
VGGAGLRVGVDRFPAKVEFARRRIAGASFVAADAHALPLASGHAARPRP